MKAKKRTKTIVGFIVLAVIIGIAGIAVFFIIEKNKTPENLLKILPDKVDLQIKNVHYTDITESGMKWEITADMARYIKKDNVALFEKITVKFITEEGKTFLLTADKGHLKTDIKDMDVTGNVKIISNNSDTFMTNDLHYSNSGRTFHTKAPIVMENRRIKIIGKGMSLSLKDENLTLLSSVKAQIR